MPQRKFKLEPQAPARVIVKWRGFWKDVTVLLDGQPLGPAFPDAKALKAGGDFPLPEGGVLRVKLSPVGLGGASVLDLSRDGQALPGSDGDPKAQIKAAAVVTWVIAALSTLFGALAVARVDFVLRLGLDWTTLAFGVVYAVLGAFVLRRSRLALTLALLLLALDTLLSLVGGLEAGGRPPIAALAIRVIFFLTLLRGFPAMKSADAADERERATGAF